MQTFIKYCKPICKYVFMLLISILFTGCAPETYHYVSSDPTGASVFAQRYIHYEIPVFAATTTFKYDIDKDKWEYKCKTPCFYKLPEYDDRDYVAVVWEDGEIQVDVGPPICDVDTRNNKKECRNFRFVKKNGQEEKYEAYQREKARNINLAEAERRDRAETARLIGGLIAGSAMVAQQKLAPYQRNISSSQQFGNRTNKIISEQAFQMAADKNPELAVLRSKIAENVKNDPIALAANRQVDHILRNATAGGTSTNSPSDILSKVGPWSCPNTPPQVKLGECIRDTHVAAAAMYAWAAECYTQQGETVKAESSISQMNKELSTAHSYCSSAPSVAGAKQCATLNIYPCP